MNRRSFFVSLGALPIVAKGLLKAKDFWHGPMGSISLTELEQRNIRMIRQVNATIDELNSMLRPPISLNRTASGKEIRKALLQRQIWPPSQLR